MVLNEVKIISKWKVTVETDDVVIDVVSEYENDATKYNFYINGIKKEFEKEQELEILDHILKNIDQHELEYVIANEDYNNFYNSLSFEELVYYFDNDFELMKDSLTSVLEIFVEQEHYEKCNVIKNILTQIK
jgi:hypothetical protein